MNETSLKSWPKHATTWKIDEHARSPLPRECSWSAAIRASLRALPFCFRHERHWWHRWTHDGRDAGDIERHGCRRFKPQPLQIREKSSQTYESLVNELCELKKK